MKIGFSKQDFQNVMPVYIESLAEMIQYASKGGYLFIGLLDIYPVYTV